VTAAGRRKLIVSASRRQDLPGCAPQRLLDQIEMGRFEWRQPYSGKPMQLSFEPADIFCLALWSKDFGPLLAADRWDRILPLRPYFLFTINDCPSLERGLSSSLDDRLAQAATIVRRVGAERLLWRFDPIVHWIDERGAPQDNLAGFDRLCSALAGLGVERCMVSFADLYGKVLRRERRLEIRFVDPPLQHKIEQLQQLADRAAALGVQLQTCCEPELEGCHPNVARGRCIDGHYLARVIDADPTGLDQSAHPSRPGCGCTRSVDVGNYEKCAHRCAYCYANPSMD
jgi:hypothetical protein